MSWFFFQIIYFAIALRFAEMYRNESFRPLSIYLETLNDDTMSFINYSNCLWCILITMTTVGYGIKFLISENKVIMSLALFLGEY